LGRLPVCPPLFADRLEPQVDLLDRLAACRLQLGLREHQQARLVLLLQQGGRQVNRVHREERLAVRLEDLRQDLCP